MRRAILLVTILAGLLAATGFAGAVHRAADTLALAQPVFGLVVPVGLLTARAWCSRVGLAGIGLIALASVVLVLLPQSVPGEVRVNSKNLLARNHEPSPIVADNVTSGVDAVLLQKVSDRNARALDLLRDNFPHQHLCRFSGWGGIAVPTRLPFDGTPLYSTQRGITAAPVLVDGRKVWLASAHIPWPWPYETADAEAAARKLLQGLDAPVVIAGDFNAFPWTWRVRRLAAATNTRAAGPVRPTLFVARVPLPIDIAFAPGSGTLERRPRLGSDHVGIMAALTLTP